MANGNWYASKTKWAGIVGGLALALPGILSWLNGAGLGYKSILEGVAAVLAVFGIRDLPVLNTKK